MLMAHRSGAGIGALFCSALILLLVATQAAALHEIDHRYTVEGYALDDQQQPRSGVTVVLSMENRALGQAVTSSSGFFSIRAHLHDPDIGKTLELRAGKSRGEIRMQAKHGDQSTARIHHANLIGGKLVEGELKRSSPLVWRYAAGGGIVVLVIAAIAIAQRRRKPGASPPKKSKTGANKRKKKKRKR